MSEWITQYELVATLLFTGVVAIATVVYAVLTWRLVWETRKMREAQTEPKLAAFFEPIEEFVIFGYLYIHNIGMGPAYDITFTLKPEGSVAGAQMLIKDFGTAKFLERGLRYLGPGQKARSGYTKFPEGFDEKIKATVVVEMCYRNAIGRSCREEIRIDFSEFEGTTRLGKPHLYSIAKSLEDLQHDFHLLCTGFSKLGVNVFDTKDRELQLAELRKLRAQQAQLSSDEGGGT